MRVAFLGLGIMGRSMASNLAKAGHEVAVWNRTAGRAVEGAQTAASPAAAAAEAEVVWMCVADTEAVERVLFAADGAASQLREGMVVVDSSTIAPSATLEFAAKVRERGADYIDAPVTGSKIAAEGGQLIFIAGGNAETLQKIEPLFQAMGKTVMHMGEVGKGQSAKLCMNLMIALIYEGFAEALVLGRKLGVQPDNLIALIQASMVRSGVVDYKAPFVQRRDFSPNFPARLMYKDIQLMLEAARQARAKLPGLETVKEIYELACEEEGQQDLDYAATLMLLERWAGLEEAPPQRGNSARRGQT
jgi:3-hydroxyisobutyrate dehydrogenase-like beta-hydroxyacid dehydrogenase